MMSARPEANDYFEIPGYSPPSEPQVYTPMGRVTRRVGQVVRYRYDEHNQQRHKLGVVTKQLGIFPATGHPYYEISFTTSIQHPLLPEQELAPSATLQDAKPSVIIFTDA